MNTKVHEAATRRTDMQPAIAKGYKTLDELSFADLYVEEADEDFPHIRAAINELFSRTMHRRKKMETGYIFHLPSLMHILRMRLKWI